MSLISGKAFLVDETISDTRVEDSPVEIRSSVTITVNGTGTLIVRSLDVATTASDIEIYSP